MRILHLIGDLAPSTGGPPKACREMAAAVAALGHRVVIYTTDFGLPSRLDVPTDRPVTENGVEIRYFALPVNRPGAISSDLWRTMARTIREFDLVYIHGLYRLHGALGGHLCRKYGIPYVIMPHSALDPFIYRKKRYKKLPYELLFERRNLRSAAAIHYTAEDERRLASEAVGELPAIVAPLGIHLAEFERLPPPGTFRRAYSEVGDRRIVLFFSRITLKKGLDILVDAFSLLLERHADLHLVIAGPDDEGYGRHVREWVGQKGMRDRVTFTGMLRGELRLAVLVDAAVFALPSYSENFGLVVLEAMATRLPVVISDRVNIWREIRDSGAGLVTACDAGQCARAIEQILGNPAAAREMGEHGRAHLEVAFAWQRIGRQLEEAYRKLLAAPRSAGA